MCANGMPPCVALEEATESSARTVLLDRIMIESVLAPVFFAIILLALVVYVGIRRMRRRASDAVSDRTDREDVGHGDAADERRSRRRIG